MVQYVAEASAMLCRLCQSATTTVPSDCSKAQNGSKQCLLTMQ